MLAGAETGLAWGARGHRIVAQIASWNLGDEARRQVRELLGRQSLVEVSTWADEVRGDDRYDWISPLHYVNLDPELGRFESCPPEGCVVDAIRSAITTLGDPQVALAERRLALKLLVHFVGDVHQPLHVSHAADRGGNDLAVDFFGQPSNLHAVWDGGILSRRQGSWRRLARRLDDSVTAADRERARAAIEVWVDESYQLAIETVYPSLAGAGSSAAPTARLGRDYVDRHRPIVEQRLRLAGLRLAATLNAIWRDG